MIKVFRKGDKVRSTKDAYNIFRFKGGLQHGIVVSNQRTLTRVTVRINGKKSSYTYHVDFWKLDK